MIPHVAHDTALGGAQELNGRRHDRGTVVRAAGGCARGMRGAGREAGGPRVGSVTRDGRRVSECVSAEARE